MSKIEIPARLGEVLAGNKSLAHAIGQLADRVGVIAADNKTPFFPDYTDHGVDHINGVLKSEVELVPPDIWTARTEGAVDPIFTAEDAAVLIGGTLLHDFAMHLREDGFLDLIKKDSRFRPLPWFDEDHEDHTADRPWPDLWADYEREARRFSDQQLTDIIGKKLAAKWKFEGLPKDEVPWSPSLYRVIGEFIRRHHDRLAHEIAIYGFPGADAGEGEHQFPAMGRESGHQLAHLADLIGLVARSHGISLRVCMDYLRAH